MPKKLDYTSVQEFINKKSNGECVLISTEYINSTTPLLLKCKCGNCFTKTFEKCKNGFFMCKECLNKYRSKKYSLNIEYIKNEITKKGCSYISGEYVNNFSKLTLKCSCGNIFKKDYNHFKRQPRCSKCGNDSLKLSKQKYSLEYAKEYFLSRDFELLETKYIGCHIPMKCKCKNGHIQYKKMIDLKQQKHGCNICVINQNSGENHWNYKGGTNELFDTLRKDLKQWKLQVLKNKGYRCELSNKKTNLEVHHLKNFVDIVYETLNVLKLPLYRKCSKYNSDELMKIRRLFLENHSVDMGVVLTKELHKKFHTIYGIHNNTISQFEEFKNNFHIKSN